MVGREPVTRGLQEAYPSPGYEGFRERRAFAFFTYGPESSGADAPVLE